MVEQLSTTVTIIKAVEVILTLIIIPLAVAICNLMNGMKCQLRSDMLHVYYRHRESKLIRQYELENFVHLYKAYKSLRGNSFVDKIYKEVMTWEVTS